MYNLIYSNNWVYIPNMVLNPAFRLILHLYLPFVYYNTHELKQENYKF